jgi:hypothetical protein
MTFKFLYIFLFDFINKFNKSILIKSKVYKKNIEIKVKNTGMVINDNGFLPDDLKENNFYDMI